MFGSAQRIALRAMSLATLLVLGAMSWPLANLQGQEKDEKKASPPPSLVPALLPLAPVQQFAQPTTAPVLVPQPIGQPGPSFPPPVPVPVTEVLIQPPPRSNSSGGTTIIADPRAVFVPPMALSIPAPSPMRFPFAIDPKTPLKELLPVAPKIKNAGPNLSDDLTQVPEVAFGAPVTKDAEAMRNTAHMIAKINHLNSKKAEGFLEALRGERTDLRGMPFAMGDACRTKGDRNQQFTAAVTTVRGILQQGVNADQFWAQYMQNWAQCDALLGKNDREKREHDCLARIAALMQILAPESPSIRLGLVKYLSTVSHVESTRALAKLAIFSAEDEIRQAATDALKLRRERDYTDVLLQGMRYPWPTIAKRASEALVKLERNDLIPQLIEMLDEPDPRSPVVKEIEEKKVPVIREMVKLNHHRNCLLCHAPANTGTVGAETLTVGVPTPDQPLNPPNGGYNQGSSPDLLVRLDVTYLRQDFSMMQAVADAAPWPEMQRFDFIVRTRELTEEEAATFREKLDKREKGRISPYQRAAVTALRDLTGKDTGPTSAAWRELLEQPERKQN